MSVLSSETSTISEGLGRRSAPRRVDPGRFPSRPPLELPDRDPPLDALDRLAARGEGVRSVRRDRDDRDRLLPDREPPDPMPDEGPGVGKRGAEVPLDLLELALGHLAPGRVLDRFDREAVVAVADD